MRWRMHPNTLFTHLQHIILEGVAVGANLGQRFNGLLLSVDKRYYLLNRPIWFDQNLKVGEIYLEPDPTIPAKAKSDA